MNLGNIIRVLEVPASIPAETAPARAPERAPSAPATRPATPAEKSPARKTTAEPVLVPARTQRRHPWAR
jgi:hypothetical protein